MNLNDQKSTAAAWFRELRDSICREFEKIENEYKVPEAAVRSAIMRERGASDSDLERSGKGELESQRVATPSELEPGFFERKIWTREGGGGGEMSIMKGRVFEKVGVNISTVHGEFSEQFRKEIPGAAEDPRFWASGISLVAHMCNPHVPAVHMNTRMVVVGEKKVWFGGGADLNPMFENNADRDDFHAAFKATCDATDPAYYEKFTKWCDEYFWLKHRNESRGVGGIFYDYLETEWQKHFAFTQDVGKTFLSMYPQLVRRNMARTWTGKDREHQLRKRGRYVEFNLLYDRGTRFGLMTGGNTDAILMSLPPLAKWD